MIHHRLQATQRKKKEPYLKTEHEKLIWEDFGHITHPSTVALSREAESVRPPDDPTTTKDWITIVQTEPGMYTTYAQQAESLLKTHFHTDIAVALGDLVRVLSTDQDHVVNFRRGNLLNGLGQGLGVNVSLQSTNSQCFKSFDEISYGQLHDAVTKCLDTITSDKKRDNYTQSPAADVRRDTTSLPQLLKQPVNNNNNAPVAARLAEEKTNMAAPLKQRPVVTGS